jgi:hypothetical protein
MLTTWDDVKNQARPSLFPVRKYDVPAPSKCSIQSAIKIEGFDQINFCFRVNTKNDAKIPFREKKIDGLGAL